MVSGPSESVELRDYDPRWAALFEEERERLAPVFDGRAVAIEHVGSTSVPGLCAKPIVDVLVGVRELELSDEQITAMKSLGYEYMGEHGLPGRLFFRKEPRTH
ncbi:MAG: GrpB family protein, partial [Actinomycetota bacterium]|nr:GrpB family protein [Actinomycetota bacterium]